MIPRTFHTSSLLRIALAAAVAAALAGLAAGALAATPTAGAANSIPHGTE